MMLSPPQSPSPRRPALSIVVPYVGNSVDVDADLGLAKQKRLFPIACRVVPADQWFTTRIDRTWHVQDLKIWLLSKALPSNILPLPPSYRPSSPVTFATAAASSLSPPSPISEDEYTHVELDKTERTVAIPYSFNTGTPSISGMNVLRMRERETESELMKRATVYGRRWALYSFSTGMLLSDNLPLSEFHLRPNELLELHQAGSYVPLPRTLLPIPRPLEPRKNKTIIWRGGNDNSHGKKEDEVLHRRNYHHHGSPYAQAYFECAAWVLQMGHTRKKRDRNGKVKEREREKEREKEGKGKEREREKEGKGKEREDDGWKRAYLIIREGRVTVRREAGREDEDHWEMTGIAGLYGPSKLKTLTNLRPPSTLPHPQSVEFPLRQASHTGAHIHNRGWHDKEWGKSAQQKKRDNKDTAEWTICVRFRGGGWFVAQLDDEDTHDHLLRIFHRISYSVITSSSHVAPARTLRTDFLPSQIPHPSYLQFSAPSPVDGDDEVEGFSIRGEPPHHGSGMKGMIGLGRTIGVRFPEWREEVIRRAIEAGLGGYPGKEDETEDRGDDALDELYDSDDGDRDSDTFSEAEWEGWAYDLDRVKAGLWDSPRGSVASGSDGEEKMKSLRRGRAKSINGASDGQAGGKTNTAAEPTVTRHRASTISARSPTTATATATATARGRATARFMLDDTELASPRSGGPKKSLIRGLSMKAGKESLMRGLENALDFVEGK